MKRGGNYYLPATILPHNDKAVPGLTKHCAVKTYEGMQV
jgi:hypothetical protein